jgi:segregation and condensation protein A
VTLDRALSDFTVELEVYSGPYEWLLALILKEELEIFEVPLRELVSHYVQARDPEVGEDEVEEVLSPEQLARRLTRYLMVRRGAQALRERFRANAGHYPSAHILPPRPGRLHLDPDRLLEAARRSFSRPAEPPVRHLGPITVTLQELASLIRSALAGGGPVPYEELVRDMDRLRSAVAFAAALSLAHEGHLVLRQAEPLGPLTLEPIE